MSDSVAKMTAYIAAHLFDPITARDLAQAAGYSQYHAARLFRRELGLAPFEYLRRERLTASARALRRGQRRVIDIALDYVFDSHAGFTRAFANGFGISPWKYAHVPPPVGWIVPTYYLNRAHPGQEHTMTPASTVAASTVFVQIVTRPARKLVLRRSHSADDYFSYVAEVGCGESDNSAPWDALSQIREALYEPVGVWLPDAMRTPGTGSYAHGVEVPADFAGPIPDGFDTIDLPACQLMVFQGEPYDDASFDRAVGTCVQRIDAFNPQVYGYRWAPELAPRMQLSPQGWRGYIELRPVAPLV